MSLPRFIAMNNSAVVNVHHITTITKQGTTFYVGVNTGGKFCYSYNVPRVEGMFDAKGSPKSYEFFEAIFEQKQND
jgi:hypothetical protein